MAFVEPMAGKQRPVIGEWEQGLIVAAVVAVIFVKGTVLA